MNRPLTEHEQGVVGRLIRHIDDFICEEIDGTVQSDPQLDSESEELRDRLTDAVYAGIGGQGIVAVDVSEL